MKWKKQLRKGLPGFDRRKVAKRKLVSLLQRSKPKSTHYKDKWAVDVFRNWQAAREKKIDFQTHVFGYPNMCVWISNHAGLDLFFTGYQGVSM